MKVSYNKLRLCAVGYAAIPIIIFFLGWISIGWALLFSALLVAAVFVMIKNSSDNDGEHTHIEIPARNIVAIAVISVLWCLVAGQGDFMHQSSDHIIRDAIFHDLVREPWPVIYSDNQMLCYYIAHWMPSAAIGKLVFALSGSTFAGYLTGNIAMLIWSSAGVFITLMILSVITARGQKVHIFLSAFIFILFSGLDIIGSVVTGNSEPSHIEWWTQYAQFSSVTTCLFWVYNQTIVSWMMTLCLINEKKPENFALIGIMVFPYGPFPFIGILIICLVKFLMILNDSLKSKTIKTVLLKETLTLQNILGVLAVAPVYMLYYTANAIISNDVYQGEAKINVGFRVNECLRGDSALPTLGGMLIFLLLEIGCYLLIIICNNKIKKRSADTFYICSLMLVFTPFFQVGIAYDFCMRVSIPLIVYICVEFIRVVIENLPEKNEKILSVRFIKTRLILIASVIFFSLGAVTPIIEFSREISETVRNGVNLETEYYSQESLECWSNINNFAARGYENSAYYKIFSKK